MFDCTKPSIQKDVLLLNSIRSRLINFDQYRCFFDKRTYTFLSITSDVIHSYCSQDKSFIVYSAIVTVAVVFVIIFAAFYRYRWKLRWWLYSGRRYFMFRKENHDDRNYIFDAFISYNEKDIGWVRQNLLHFEKKYNLRFCIHHRDFTLGIPIDECIVYAIEKSRRTILVITNKFVESNWCSFEVRMARQASIEEGRNIILPILVGNPQIVKENRGILCDILHKNNYVEWSDDPEGKEIAWQRLLDRLRK